MSANLVASCWKLLFRILITILQRDFMQDEDQYKVAVVEIALDAAQLGQRFIAEGYE